MSRALHAARPAHKVDEVRCPWPATTALRLWLAITSLLSLAVGLSGLITGVGALRTIGLLVFCAVGIGSAPWQLNRSVQPAGRLALTALTSISVLALVATAMVTARSWHPAIAFFVTAAACVVLHLVGAGRAVHEGHEDWQSFLRHCRTSLLARARPRRPVRPSIFAMAPALSALTGGGLCVVAALTHRHIDPGFGGFLAQIGQIWYVGLALVLTGIVFARGDGERQLAIGVVVLMVVLTLTPALVYDGPRSQSSAKHVDLVEQIRALHTLNSAVAVYNAWAGFFAAAAWICDVAGIRDPMRLATFWPALLGLFRLAALRYFFGQVLRSPYRRWIAVALAVLADPLGADYFSPQSVGFVLGIIVFGLSLSRRRTATRVLLILLAGCVLTISHQLSPYIVGGVMIVLVIFRQVRPWWTPALVLVPAIGWALAHADALRGFISLKDIGQAQNFLPPQTVASSTLQRLPIVQLTVVALLAEIFLVGTLAAVTLLRHRRELRLWGFAACPAVGLVLIATNPYGQEGIFRAVLFGIPWLVLLAAQCFSPPQRLLRRLPVVAVCASLTAAFVVASFGLDATNVVRPSDLAALRYYQHLGERQSGTVSDLLVLGGGDLPVFIPMKGGTHQILGRDSLELKVNQPPPPTEPPPKDLLPPPTEPPPAKQPSPQPPPLLAGLPQRDSTRQEPGIPSSEVVARLTAELIDYSGQPAPRADLYALWSPLSSVYDSAYAIQSPREFAALRDAFATSPYWNIDFAQEGTILFHFDSARYDAGSP